MGITKEIVLGPKEVAVVTSVALTEPLQNWERSLKVCVEAEQVIKLCYPKFLLFLAISILYLDPIGTWC
jgi:hypothetical protein